VIATGAHSFSCESGAKKRHPKTSAPTQSPVFGRCSYCRRRPCHRFLSPTMVVMPDGKKASNPFNDYVNEAIETGKCCILTSLHVGHQSAEQAFDLALRSDNEGERNASLNALRRVLERTGIDPHGLQLGQGNFKFVSSEMADASLRRKVVRLRRNIGLLELGNEQLKRKKERLMEAVDTFHDRRRTESRRKRDNARWVEFKAAVAHSLYNYGSTDYLPRGWRGQAAYHLGVDIDTLKRWRDGREPIPQEVIQSLRKVGK
jgi:hypothetical protein